jgi:UDP-galactopyranose mutase
MKKDFDYLIVGSGLFGAVCARKLTDYGYKCLVIDKRSHIAGNCFTRIENNIDKHVYGPHIFHTSNEEVWKFVNQYTEFNNFILSPVANFKGEIYSLPFNMWTFSKMWDIKSPQQAKDIIEFQSRGYENPKNLEEQAIKLVGKEIYEKLIKGYTEKQWMKKATELPPEIIKRLPVRFTYDNNYFNDKFQGIPVKGYTKMFEKLLEGIELHLNVDFFAHKSLLESWADKIIYTGPIDRFFDFKHGYLEYKTTSWVDKVDSLQNGQGCAVMNFTDSETEYTRIIEHRHFTPDREVESTILSYEFPKEFIPNKSEPMYPVNDAKNNSIYGQYFNETLGLKNYYFGGRLAEYKYYDMDKVILSAFEMVDKLKTSL